LQLGLSLLRLALGLLGLVLCLPRLVLGLQSGAAGVLGQLSRALRILLRLASLVFDALQVALQLADRQASKRALVLMTLPLGTVLVPLASVGAGLLRWGLCGRHRITSFMVA
jgi:hypothetical protein